jgi:ubiquinone/menaquinone biosynthesis C-methylase UbiE
MNLDHFVCPETGALLRRKGDALTGGAEPYPIVNDIPRFVVSDNYAEAFGLQWNKFKRTQLDSHTGTPLSEERLVEAFGHDLSGLAGKRILEAGSGAGRFTEVLLEYGAQLYSFDYSNAVEANRENNFPNERLTLFQGDIRHIPFPDGFFDAVVCLGVLQHTPDTNQSLKELARVLKRGGEMVTDHYRWHLGNFTSLHLVWWSFIKRLPREKQLRATEALTKFFYPIHWRFRKSELAQKAIRRFSPLNFHYGVFDLSDELLYEWSRLDTHDRNTDHFKRHVTRGQYERMLKRIGLSEVNAFVAHQGVVARCVK